MEIKGVFGAGLLSIQVMTELGRPFPAWTVLCDIKENGQILWRKEADNFRASVIEQLRKEEK